MAATNTNAGIVSMKQFIPLLSLAALLIFIQGCSVGMAISGKEQKDASILFMMKTRT